MRDYSKKQIYIDMDGTLCDFFGPFLKSRQENPSLEFPHSKIGYFKELLPLPGAIDAFNELKKYYDVWILTRPSFKNIHCFTEKAEWVLEYLGYDSLEKLVICGDKSLLKGDYLIDDNGQNGQGEFEGEWIHFDTDKYPDWDSVLKYLIKDKKPL